MFKRQEYDFEEDVSKVVDSIKNKMGKEFRIDPDVTVGKALSEIWGDLDIALLGANDEHVSQRIKVMNTVIDRLDLNEEQKVSEVLGSEYLLHPYLRNIIYFENAKQYKKFLRLAEETKFCRRYE
jgi:hypothetical protein